MTIQIYSDYHGFQKAVELCVESIGSFSQKSIEFINRFEFRSEFWEKFAREKPKQFKMIITKSADHAPDLGWTECHRLLKKNFPIEKFEAELPFLLFEKNLPMDHLNISRLKISTLHRIYGWGSHPRYSMTTGVEGMTDLGKGNFWQEKYNFTTLYGVESYYEGTIRPLALQYHDDAEDAMFRYIKLAMLRHLSGKLQYHVDLTIQKLTDLPEIIVVKILLRVVTPNVQEAFRNYLRDGSNNLPEIQRIDHEQRRREDQILYYSDSSDDW